MVKLKRLKINKYRNVRPGTELRFDDGFNLVLGQNASGKTALLSLISMVCRSVFKEIEHEEFALEYTLAANTHTIQVTVTHQRQTDGPEPRLWDDAYTIRIDDGANDPSLISSDDKSSSTPLFMDWSFIAAALTNRKDSRTSLRSELLIACGNAYRFDESLDGFAAMTGRDSLLKGAAAPPPTYFQLREVRVPRGVIDVTEGAYIPNDLANAIQKAFKARSESINVSDAARPLADQIAAALGVKRLEIVPQIRERLRNGAESSSISGGFDAYIFRSDGSVHHDRWSYGQKRLVAFFYFLALNRDVVIADELVNGLHHRWIQACMEAIGDRQAFLTSQNPLLFDYIPDFESAEQVQSRFVTCKTEIVDGVEQLVWQNMPADHARVFYDAYKDELEQVGEILIARGLW